MILIPHPDAPKNKGGAPKKKSAKATALQHSIVNDFAAELSKANGEVESAVKALEKKHGVSRAAVFRARKAVEAENIAIGQREAMKRESDRWHNEFELRHRRAMEKLKADVSQKT
jgi:hypothetical protein